jgi:nucleotide-binding universal stress UspA family protein
MFRSILVPLDGSHFSEQSIPTAADFAADYDASLHLVHVHIPPMVSHLAADSAVPYAGVASEGWDEECRRGELEYMDRLARNIGNVPAEDLDTRILDGRVSDAIRKFADESDVDLIVMASHGHTGVERLWLGSVTEALARRTTKPLLILRPSENGEEPLKPMRVEHVLVGLDGSDESEAILAPVRALGKMGAKVTLLHVVSEGGMFGAEGFPLRPDGLERIMDRADEYLDSVARGLEADLGHVSLHVEMAANPAKGILHVAESLGADLVAMATHGRTGLRRALLGSVADKVLRAATRPVLLKKPELILEGPAQ